MLEEGGNQMPYRKEPIDPEVFVEHKGVKVYFTYDDEDIEQRNHILLDPDGEENWEFDVRELGIKLGMLPRWRLGEDISEHDAREIVIRAIEGGYDLIEFAIAASFEPVSE
jgi:hypothetical protein